MNGLPFYREEQASALTFPMDPRYRNADEAVSDEFIAAEFIVYNQEAQVYECELCRTSHPNRAGCVAHTASRRHVNQKAWREYEDMDKDPTKARMGDASLGVPSEIECRGAYWYRCSVCECMLPDPATAISHADGRRHKQNLHQKYSGVPNLSERERRMMSSVPQSIPLRPSTLVKAPVIRDGQGMSPPEYQSRYQSPLPAPPRRAPPGRCSSHEVSSVFAPERQQATHTPLERHRPPSLTVDSPAISGRLILQSTGPVEKRVAVSGSPYESLRPPGEGLKQRSQQTSDTECGPEPRKISLASLLAPNWSESAQKDARVARRMIPNDCYETKNGRVLPNPPRYLPYFNMHNRNTNE